MFQGRYGNDHLNRALGLCTFGFLALYLVLGIFFQAFHPVRRICYVLSLLSAGLTIFRMLSRNFEARRRENEKYLVFESKLRARFGKDRAPRAKTANANPTWEERRKYKYLICPQCAQRLRVPRGKGKLRVTCTRCGNKFDVKS